MVKRFDWELTISFAILAFTLFFIGLNLVLQIKKNFPQLHNGYRCYLWAAVIVLTLPLLLRSLTNIAWRYWWTWPADEFGEALYNAIFSIITDYIPIVCQIASLVFGFVRKKQVKIVKKKEMTRSQISDDDSNTIISDINTNVGDESYFDPPIENYKSFY